RDCEANRLSRLEVDCQLEFGCLLDGKVTWLGATQYLIDVIHGAQPPSEAGAVGRRFACRALTAARAWRHSSTSRFPSPSARPLISADACGARFATSPTPCAAPRAPSRWPPPLPHCPGSIGQGIRRTRWPPPVSAARIN